MKVIDFHLHLSQKPDLNEELRILDYDIRSLLIQLSIKLKKAKIDKGMVFLLDTRVLTKEQDLETMKKLINSHNLSNLFFSVMLDFRRKDVYDILDRAASCGVNGVKFHPIHQKILPQDYERIKELAILADSKGLMIVIDTHYVGYDCDVYSGLRLAKFILPSIKGPVVLAHSGGLKVLEAVVLALDYKNVYLDISFSIPFWAGSSIEKDFAFAIKKVGSGRCIYGSDTPFIDLNFAKEFTEKFLMNYGFSPQEKENIFYNTANDLLEKRSIK